RTGLRATRPAAMPPASRRPVLRIGDGPKARIGLPEIRQEFETGAAARRLGRRNRVRARKSNRRRKAFVYPAVGF
ncbi:hypothetical protein, partial [Methylobacterium sp. WL6]|uniref:hypothetical protein n=1 Tax=Methylobacterium sp. WL6 TaxID=2603901 RepID=UPI001AEEF8D4